MTPLIMNLPLSYAKEYLQRDRIIPLIDQKIESILWQFRTRQHELDFPIVDDSVLKNSYSADMFGKFKSKVLEVVSGSKLNKVIGLGSFAYCDIMQGCTQYIDNLYVQYGRDQIQVLEGEYKYHYRLFPELQGKHVGQLEPNKHLILSCPFVNGRMHDQMHVIFQECKEKNIKIHLDMAWLTAAKNVNIDLSLPCIESVGISLSKGYGLSGWNRVGIRLNRNLSKDTISLMTEYYQTLMMPVATALYFLDQVPTDHLWSKHYENYNRVCEDFNLTPTDTVHVANENNYVVGLTPLLRYLEYNV